MPQTHLYMYADSHTSQPPVKESRDIIHAQGGGIRLSPRGVLGGTIPTHCLQLMSRKVSQVVHCQLVAQVIPVD